MKATLEVVIGNQILSQLITLGTWRVNLREAFTRERSMPASKVSAACSWLQHFLSRESLPSSYL